MKGCLYPGGIKNVRRLKVEDLRQIAAFNKIVKNYIRMCEMSESKKR